MKGSPPHASPFVVYFCHTFYCHPSNSTLPSSPESFRGCGGKKLCLPAKQKVSHSNAPRQWLCAKNKQPKAKLHNAAL